MNFFLLKHMLLSAGILLISVLSAQVPDVKTMDQAQRISYTMNIDFNAQQNTFIGYQQVNYNNNCPDTLNAIFYHLFFNAFQPGSAMEERAMFIRDQEGFGQKIQALKPSEYGYQLIDSIKINGIAQPYVVTGTILKINPLSPIAPYSVINIELWFKSQVPKMVMRGGRYNSENVAFTMTQWYPKIAAYDRAGWHADEYIRHEFYGSFADFDVSIKIDKAYTVAATGILQNAEQVGHGYDDAVVQSKTKELTWHFKASTVHDFAWAADSTYTHLTKKVSDSLQFHFFYKPETATVEDWQKLPQQVTDIFNWMTNKVGSYPYPQYSLVQGGSGGTEYPMLSMILGHRPAAKGISKGHSILTLAIHEIMHNWWYGAVANNEIRNPWLDEGFALFFQYEYTDEIEKNQRPAIRASYDVMLPPAKLHALEPMSTPADYYDANWSYDVSAYHKGAVFLNQLKYIIGEELFWNGMKKYYSRWKFKYPDGDDFINCMEQASGMQLKWYLDLWTGTNKYIDYSVTKVEKNGQQTAITITRKGDMPMPIDLCITLKNGTQINYTIPLTSMYGTKKIQGLIAEKPWSWTNPQYKLVVPYPYESIKHVELDPEKFLFDVEIENNRISLP